LLPFFVIGVASGLFTAWVERRFIGAEGQSFDLSLVERGLIAGRVLWFYFFKLLWPAKLTFTYPHWHVSQAVWWQYLFPVAAAVVVIGLFLLRKRSRAPLAGVLIFAGTLFPVLGFVNVYPFIYSFVADHFQYIASIGIIALFAAGISLLMQRYAARNRIIIYGAPGALLLVLVILTWQQAATYGDAQTLYQVTLQRNPESWMAHNNLGIILSEQGDIAAAIAHYEQAMTIEPRNAESYTNLGNAYMMQGRVSEALPQYEKTLALAPRAVQAKNNLAWLLPHREINPCAIRHALCSWPKRRWRLRTAGTG
jgi:tetratricopeptide (TPR) repeat protein